MDPAVIVAICTAIPLTLAQIVNLVATLRNSNKQEELGKQQKELHAIVNSKLDTVVAAERKVAHTEGLLDGATAAVAAQTQVQGHPSMIGALNESTESQSVN